MQLVVVQGRQELGAAAAKVIAEQVRANPRSVLGIATGASPLPVYAQLAADSGTDYRQTTCFALDEYVGLAAPHPQSYGQFVRDHVSGPLGIAPERIHVPDGLAEDLEDACALFEQEIEAAGGVDLQVLGIGRNGHLAFNEPGSAVGSRTRVVPLSADTRRANARFFPNPSSVPTHAVTQGLGTILAARHLLLLASGPEKASAVERAVNGSVTTDCPASVIQLHPHVTVIADEQAADSLGRVEAMVPTLH
ncbi:glucosamine-6-phosphate deaminase [Paenarthrobacter sp. GOM3]|uniref:glucosamine-6-phosphate deaminase n=1 Tax=Paenarthrobacter sp. GOM3 TaxID=2782567 RepID=UPI001BAA0C49|nr:glucosamine-6-phosphate deaminase [Paenarthrobacter sp. GOM3]WOH19203.1 glucosamine-6-phosphate deaminase [Paenarthrobacter sp. GOM3]